MSDRKSLTERIIVIAALVSVFVGWTAVCGGFAAALIHGVDPNPGAATLIAGGCAVIWAGVPFLVLTD